MGKSDTPPLTQEALFASLEPGVPPVRVTLLYRLWMLIVAVLMVLLPVIYAGLIVVVGFAVYLHARYDVVMFDHMPANRGAIFVIAAYLAPIVAGSVAVLFMIKPFFAPKREQFVPLSLERNDQPVLFTFIDRLADAVGAPPPSRIDVDCQVNASAGFRRGILSFFGGDLVLTIGLPLVSGMTLSQFAGVVAHEFGHFAQGGGMRITYVVRSVNTWFARVVYERDAWDDRLDAWVSNSPHIAVLLVVLFTKLMVWLSRKVLWVLMWVGHLASCFMLRQMEYDADRYETRIAGSPCFVKTTHTLPLIGVAQQVAFNDLRQTYNTGMLPDNLPALIRFHQKNLPAEAKQFVAKATDPSQKTGLFDTHPSHSDRIASAERENAPGILHFEDKASVLFRDYDKLCRIASAHHYQLVLGEQYERVKLVPTKDMVHRRKTDEKANESLARFFAGALHSLAPVWVDGATTKTATVEQAREQLGSLRDRLTRDRKKIDQLQKQFSSTLENLLNARRAQVLAHGGLRIRSGDFGLTSAASGDIAQAVERGGQALEVSRAQLQELAGLGTQRIALALHLLEQGDLPGLDDERVEKLRALSRGPVAALRAMQRQQRHFEELALRYDAASLIIQNLQRVGNAPQLVEELQAVTKQLARLIGQVHAGLRDTSYPFEHAAGKVTLARYILEMPPAPSDIGAVYNAADQVHDRWCDLYRQLLSRLATISEQVEASLGFKPLAAVETNATDVAAATVA